MNRSYWLGIAKQSLSLEEQRYCYQRMIEENEEDYEAYALLKQCGPGPARAPRNLSPEVVIIKQARGYQIHYEEEEREVNPFTGIIVMGALIAIVAVAVFIVMRAL